MQVCWRIVKDVARAFDWLDLHLSLSFLIRRTSEVAHIKRIPFLKVTLMHRMVYDLPGVDTLRHLFEALFNLPFLVQRRIHEYSIHSILGRAMRQSLTAPTINISELQLQCPLVVCTQVGHTKTDSCRLSATTPHL